MLDEDEYMAEPAKFSDNPEFEEYVDQLMANLFEMNGHLSTLKQFIATLERNREHGNVKSKMVANIDKRSVYHIDETTKLLKIVNTLVHKINAIEETALGRGQLISRDKLIRDVKYSVQEFQDARKEFTNTSKAMNEQAKVALAQEEETRNTAGSNANGAVLEQQQQQQQQQVVIEREAINNEEFAYQQNLIQQRDQEISYIESGVTELNEIFRDLGTIVQQQGHLVDNIESNIYSVANDAQSGARELTKAMRYQRGSNKRCLMILAVVSLLLVMFILVALS
ncbi:LANO_0H22958g1_1 [Lachancea nothofagi CBS 11611]|uniref:LANO_0H22958g1_1 n=1 Tax=Lachancea nothofagi CBS 11611 TaxID=1266666 RepID=A0A1G4KNR2_9SACH|nr:LANO_0H22958g1_1 [Lachancea nothofagi CBS 11611]